jgi:Protein of unknown function (DUF3800)
LTVNAKESALPTLFIFLDEGGNFDFSPKGSRFFTLTCVSFFRPFMLYPILDSYKYDLIEHRISPPIEIEYFHCADDNKFIRNKVFEILDSNFLSNSVDCVVVEKSKMGPALQPPEHFYPRMIGYLLKYAVEQQIGKFGEVIVITDNLPVARKREAIEKGLKIALAKMLPREVPYRIMHHASKAHYGLQIADYFNWAILRKWEHRDEKIYATIKSKIRSEFDIFRSGTRHYY